jgi:hypothetical protein
LKTNTRKCKYCLERYTPKYSSTEPCWKYECRIKHLEANTAKINKANKAKARNELIQEYGGKVDYSKVLQKLVQEIARLIDYDQLCLARNKPIKKVDGGHVYSRGGNANMSYNLHNIFAQGAQSNHWQSDDHLMKEGLKREFSEDYYNFVTSLKMTPISKYTNDDYELFCKKSRVAIKELKANLKKNTKQERIELRNKYNLLLSVYQHDKCVFIF